MVFMISTEFGAVYLSTGYLGPVVLIFTAPHGWQILYYSRLYSSYPTNTTCIHFEFLYLATADPADTCHIIRVAFAEYIQNQLRRTN